MDHLQEIKSRLSIEELVSSYVPLKRAGKNLKGLCPFHSEKTPSFIVSPDKDIAYCFGCQKGGDIFKMIQFLENCDFGEAVKILAEKTGVKLPRVSVKTVNKRLKIIEMHEDAVRFYQEQLEENPDKKDYFVRRGLTEKTIRQFKLGYSPDSFTALKDHLMKKGYLEPELIEGGLLIQRSLADRSSYDRFRHRLMFPILDGQGSAVGFGGRILDDGEPKYLNSPETPAYSKSAILYGLPFAKEAIKKEKMAIFVEGYMDVIAAHQAGTTHVVATSGTATSPHQLKLIKRYTNQLAFCFDQDAAGMEAALRAIELAQQQEFQIKIVQVPQGKDPDDCIRENLKAWQRAVEHPAEAMDFYFAYARRQFDPDTIEGKKGFLALLLPLIKQVPTEMEQGIHLERLAVALKTDIRLLWNDLKKAKKTVSLFLNAPEEAAMPAVKVFSREEYLLGFIFLHPTLYPPVHDQLMDNLPFDTETKPFYKALKTVYGEGRALDLEQVKQALGPEASEPVDIYRLLIEDHYPDFSEEAAEREILALVRQINRHNLTRAQKECEFKIRTLERSEDRHLLLNQYNEILKLTSKL